jgi:hypothetical protein
MNKKLILTEAAFILIASISLWAIIITLAIFIKNNL